MISRSSFRALVALLLAALVASVYSLDHNVYHEQLPDGSYLVAVPRHMGANEATLRHHLGKYFHLPAEKKTRNHTHKHDDIDFRLYSTGEGTDYISHSKDKEKLKKMQNLCYQRSQPSTLQQKLEAFKKGPCSPVVLVPGILATSLIVTIDCGVLKDKNPNIFSQCDWTGCGGLSLRSPDREYLLWVGLDLQMKVSAGKTKCFGDLFGLIYDSKSKSEDFRDFGKKYSMPEGISATWFGNEPSSKPYSECGANAIRDLSGPQSLLSIMGSQCAIHDYSRMIDTFKALGYVSGMTLQPLPYDFRYGILAGNTQQLLPQVINNLYYLTGKKVVIVAHSLGTLHTLSGLAFFVSQEMKDKMVRHYVPITPPWGGTVSAIRNMLFGDPSYFTKGLIDKGINRYAQSKFTKYSGSTFDLFLRTTIEKFKGQPWMDDVLARIKYQNEGRKQGVTAADQKDRPLNWFPSKYDKCFPSYFKRNYFCETGLINFLESPIFEINGTKYLGTDADMKKLINETLKQKEDIEVALQLWRQTKVQNKTLDDLPAPGVNTSIIFTTVYDTQIFYKYKNESYDSEANKKQAHQKTLGDNEFMMPTPTANDNAPGDISVPSFSPLIFAAKWIYNKENKGQDVQVIEYCGNYDQKKDHYSSLRCECAQNPFKNQLDCTHPCIISDKFLIGFVVSIATNSLQGYQKNTSEALSFSEKELEQFTKKCTNLQLGQMIDPKKTRHI